MKLTKTTVEMIPTPAAEEGSYKYLLYYDELLRGFGVRVNSKGKKTFFIEKRTQGKLHRISLGCLNDITVEVARRQAQSLLGQLAIGIDPLEERRRNKIKIITLREAFNEYVKVRNSLKGKTPQNYESVLNQVVPDWLDKPLTNINRDLVAKRHDEYGKKSKASANYAMRVLRAIFNFSINQYQDAYGKSLILDNPVLRLSATRAWYRIERKETLIKSYELAAWYRAATELSTNYPQQYTTETASFWQDYFLILLFTGMRPIEVRSLLWENIDLRAKTFKIIDTKNRKNHSLPMSDIVYSVFEKRRKFTNSEFVFPSKNSKNGYIIDHRKAMWRITESSGVNFIVSDLRRTFITLAESLGLSGYSLKRLLNHSMTDVTAGYIITDAERLRQPMQQVADSLLKFIKEDFP